MTLNQIAARELERGEEFCLKARREGLEPINNDIAAAEVVKDMAEHESNLDMKGKLEEQAVFMLSAASEEINKIIAKLRAAPTLENT